LGRTADRFPACLYSARQREVLSALDVLCRRAPLYPYEIEPLTIEDQFVLAHALDNPKDVITRAWRYQKLQIAPGRTLWEFLVETGWSDREPPTVDQIIDALRLAVKTISSSRKSAVVVENWD
jgi:hypothetical protein